MLVFLYLFAAFAPPHRCTVSVCEANVTAFNANWTNFAIPGYRQKDGLLAETGTRDQCQMYRVRNKLRYSQGNIRSSVNISCTEL
jgi:hypothetical protein